MASPDHRGQIVLLAASILAMALGSIHAFSVFLSPLEALFDAPRALTSVVYSAGLVFLTAAVLFGPLVYARVNPVTIFVLVAGLGGLGALIAGFGGSLGAVFLGYSVVFGVANGLGYGFGLQFAARTNQRRAGFAMGVVTAAYALGAVLAPFAFEMALALGGFRAAMIALASGVVGAGIAAALLVARTGLRYAQAAVATDRATLPIRVIAPLWVAYGCGVAAGLMAIGHAAEIASASGRLGWVAVTAMAGCNLVGSLLSGSAADRIRHRQILVALPVIGAVALTGLAVMPGFAIPLLGAVGFAYGGTIAVYPAAIASLFPGDSGPRAYGRIFTAWGAAGLVAPWFAGMIHDWSGSYAPALWVAAGLGVLSAVVARRVIV